MAKIISQTEGKTLVQNYLKNTQYQVKVGTEVIKAMAVDKDMLLAMNSLMTSHPNLAGFRIYYGLNDNTQKVGVMVGLNTDGTEATSLEIYCTGCVLGGPCPPYCDRNSQMY